MSNYQEGILMTKAELVSQVAEHSNLTQKTTEAVLKSLIGAIHDSLKKSEEIRIDGLGTFRVLQKKARTGVNPRTRAKITIPAMEVPRFSAAKGLKEAVKEPEKETGKKKK
jgi:DNA-binding protein HU-beta